jgi:hypothetical protein
MGERVTVGSSLQRTVESRYMPRLACSSPFRPPTCRRVVEYQIQPC